MTSRAVSPVSMADTFGGGHGHDQGIQSDGHRLSSEYNVASSSRSIRSDSFSSYTSRPSSIASFANSVTPHNRDAFRLRLPVVITHRSAAIPSADYDVFAHGRRLDLDRRYSGNEQEAAMSADRALRTTPGVMGVGEGWAGGPSSKPRRKWLFRRSWRINGRSGNEEDPLALWTVHEETKTSPLKSAWNRSKARFAASNPALGHADRIGKVESRSFGSRTRLAFSASKPELPRMGRRGSEPAPFGIAQNTERPVDLRPFEHAINPRSISQLSTAPKRSNKRHSIQPRPPPPRSASLPVDFVTSSAITDPLALSRVGTFGNASQSSTAVAESTASSAHRQTATRSNVASPSGSVRGSVAPGIDSGIERTHVNKRKIPLIRKIKNRLSLLATGRHAVQPSTDIAISQSSGTAAPSNTPAIMDSTTGVGPASSSPRRLRPISMIPLAPASPDMPSTTAATSQMPRSRSADLRTFLHRFGRKSSATEASDTPNTDVQEKGSGFKWKRKSFSASMPSLLKRRSVSDQHALRELNREGTETLEDLIARLQGMTPPERDCTVLGGQRLDVLADTHRTLTGRSILGDTAAPPLDSSSRTTTRSNESASTVSLVTPPRSARPHAPVVLANPIGKPNGPTPAFAWGAQPGSTTFRKSPEMGGGEAVDTMQRRSTLYM